MKQKLGRVTIEVLEGDITAQPDVDCIVNAANAPLMPGGGVAGVIHRAAGPGLAQECRPLAPILPGQAVITGGHRLPNDWVVHCLGPVYGHDHPEDQLLAGCYVAALELAEKNGIESIAFPSLSTGVFGYPMEGAARVAFGAVLGKAPGLQHVALVRFVLWGREALRIHQEALRELLAARTEAPE